MANRSLGSSCSADVVTIAVGVDEDEDDDDRQKQRVVEKFVAYPVLCTRVARRSFVVRVASPCRFGSVRFDGWWVFIMFVLKV